MNPACSNTSSCGIRHTLLGVWCSRSCQPPRILHPQSSTSLGSRTKKANRAPRTPQDGKLCFVTQAQCQLIYWSICSSAPVSSSMASTPASSSPPVFTMPPAMDTTAASAASFDRPPNFPAPAAPMQPAVSASAQPTPMAPALQPASSATPVPLVSKAAPLPSRQLRIRCPNSKPRRRSSNVSDMLIPSERQRRLSMAQPTWQTKMFNNQLAPPKSRPPVPTQPGMPTVAPVAEEDAETVVEHIEQGPWLASKPLQTPSWPSQLASAPPPSSDNADEEPTLDGADREKVWNAHVASIP